MSIARKSGEWRQNVAKSINFNTNLLNLIYNDVQINTLGNKKIKC